MTPEEQNRIIREAGRRQVEIDDALRQGDPVTPTSTAPPSLIPEPAPTDPEPETDPATTDPEPEPEKPATRTTRARK